MRLSGILIAIGADRMLISDVNPNVTRLIGCAQTDPDEDHITRHKILTHDKTTGNRVVSW